MNEEIQQRHMAERFKRQYPPGTRIVLLQMDNDPQPILPNTRGTVQFVDDMGTIHCAFDDGRSLGIIPGEDVFRKLTREEMKSGQVKIRNQSIYAGSLAEAREKGELDQWKESRRLTTECRDAIDEAIRQNYDGLYLRDACCKEVIEAYGLQRVGFVLAATIRAKSWDERISKQNHGWAQSICASLVRGKRESELQGYVCRSHSGLLNLFADQCRDVWETRAALVQEETEKLNMTL